MNDHKPIKTLILASIIIFFFALPIDSFLYITSNNFNPEIMNEDSNDDFDTASSGSQIEANQKLESRANPKFGEKIYQFCQNCQNEEVSSVEFAPNTKLIAGGTDKGEIILWDLTTGEKLFTVKASKNKINNILWTPDSSFIISNYKDAILYFWDVSTGNLTFQVDLRTKIGSINRMALSHDGYFLVITDVDSKFSLWSVDIIAQEINFVKYLSTDLTFNALDIKFSPNDDQIAIYLISSTIMIWKWDGFEFNLKTNKKVGAMGHCGTSYYKQNAIDFSSDGKELYISLLNTGSVNIMNTSSGNLITPLIPKRVNVYGMFINSVSRGINNTMIAYTMAFCPISANPGFEIFDYSSNKLILEMIDETTTTVEMSKDGSMLATIGFDQTVTIWNIIPNSELNNLVGHREIVWETDFLNESILVSSSSDSVRIWKNGMLLKSLEGDSLNNTHPSGVTITRTANKDIIVAFGTKEGKILQYNYTADSFVELIGHQGEVAELDFSLDGSLLASAGDIALKIWNTSTHSLFKNMELYTTDYSLIYNHGVEFLSNTKVVVTGGYYGGIYIFDINGTKLLYEPMPSMVLGIDVSEDKTLIGAFIKGGAIGLINLTNGNVKEQKLSVFQEEGDNIIFFADVDFTPDNRYIIACSGTRHTLYFIDTKELTIKHSIFLSIQDSFRTKLERKSWSFSVSKDDYSISLYDMSPLKTNNLDLFDFDGDGMSDFWEQDNSLSGNWYWDRYYDPDRDELVNWEEYNYRTNPQSFDSDGDVISDTYEVKYGLNPNKDDALLDKDGDGMNNLFEFKMGLDSSIDDSSLDPDLDGLSNLQEFIYQTDIHKPDTDDDGMPDKWEVDNHLNATNAIDASKDYDFDGITNLEEYQQGSDPNNFLSVPLISLNYFYLLIALVTVIIVFSSYYQYRRYITDKYSAPDYSSAVKAKRAELDSWYEYTIIENSINKRIEKAKSLLLEGLVDQSVVQYISIIDSLQLLGKEVESAEVLCKLLFIESKLLKIGNIQQYLQKFPKKGSGMLLTEYRKIVNGYDLDSTNNPGLAISTWNQVIKSEIKLSPEHNCMIKHSIMDTMITEYQVEKSQSLFIKINEGISSLVHEAEKNGYLDIVCGAYLLLARILFYNYQLKEALKVLNQVTNIAKKNKLNFYIKLVSSEVENFEKIKSSIKEGLALKDKPLFEDEEILKEYLYQASKLLSEN